MTDMTQILSHKMTSVIKEQPFNFQGGCMFKKNMKDAK